LQQLGISVVGVSYDTPEKNRAFAEKNDLPFRLLSDRDRELAKAVGAARALLPVPKRVSYLIGPDGTILEAYPDVDPKTHAAEVIGDYRGMIVAGD
jgi:peroxiredoxin Q/BCP